MKFIMKTLTLLLLSQSVISNDRLNDLNETALQGYNTACQTQIKESDIAEVLEVDSDYDYITYLVIINGNGQVQINGFRNKDNDIDYQVLEVLCI